MDRAEIAAILEEATNYRGWISNAYAQVEYLLGDLIMNCRQFPQYTAQTETFTHSAAKRVAKIRSMLEIEGPLTPYVDDIRKVLEAFELNQDVRNLLAHGFCQFHYTPTGDAGLVFRKFERGNVKNGEEPDILVQRTFRLVDMNYHREQFVAQADLALNVFFRIYEDLGWAN